MKNKKQKLFVFFQVGVVFCLLFLLPKNVFAKSLDVGKIIALTNLERIKNNLSPLSVDQKLSNAAIDKINDMIANNYFNHTSPKGIEPWHWMEKENYNYKFAGENLAMDFDNENDIVQAWMSSKTHRDNILNPDFKETGLAIKQGKIYSKNSLIVVQYFGQECIDKNVQVAENVKNVQGNKTTHVVQNILPAKIAEKKSINEQKESLNSDNNMIVLSWEDTSKNKTLNTIDILNAYIIPTLPYLEKGFEKGNNTKIAKTVNNKMPNTVLAFLVIDYLFAAVNSLFL